MFRTSRFYVVVGHKSLIIKKEGDESQNIIEYSSSVPNIPFYHHFFDEDKNYIEDMKSVVKKLKMKNALVIIPDDSIDCTADKRIFSDFFIICGVKKVYLTSQCFLLNPNHKKYIAISKTTRTIVLQYIVDNKSVVKKYYDKNYTDIDQIALDARNLHIDCQADNIPIYINNINNDMEKFKSLGTLISFDQYIANIMNNNL